MYVNKGLLLKIIVLAKDIFQFLNKHFYILAIITTISKFTNTKIYQFVSWIVKIFVLANIIFGISYILYFTDLTAFYNNLSIYNDIIKPYVEFLTNLWNEINISIEDNIIKTLVNNEYLPIKINHGQHDLFGSLYLKFKKLIIKIVNKYLK